VKLALNYRWDQNPFAVWADAPVFAVTAMPVRARPAPILQGWDVDAGMRYWYSSGTTKNTTANEGNTALLSQLTYANSTGQSGEFFARVDTPWRVFVKGYIGSGALSGGKNTDEDWGDATSAKTGFQVTSSTQSGWLNYAAADVGYDVLHDPRYKLGPFVGYSYFRQNVNALGCNPNVSVGGVCDNIGPNAPFLMQDETWQSLRVGVSAVARNGIVGASMAMSPTYPTANITGWTPTHSVTRHFLPAGRHQPRRASRAHSDLSADR
jgi:hypothetical protein